MKQVTGVILDLGNNRIGLQLRDSRPGLEFSGLVSFFGGGMEPGEQIQESLYREIREELDLSPNDFFAQAIGPFPYTDGYGDSSLMHVFVLSNINFDKLKIMEGHLYVTDISEGIGEINLVEPLRPMLLNYLERIGISKSLAANN